MRATQRCCFHQFTKRVISRSSPLQRQGHNGVYRTDCLFRRRVCFLQSLHTQLTHITVHGTLCAHIFSSNKVRFANRTRGKGWTEMPSNKIFLPFQLLHALTCSESINLAENRCEKARALLRLHPLLPTRPLVTRRMSGSYMRNFCRYDATWQ